MPGEGANRFAQIARALQWDRGRWIWLLAIVLSLDLVLALGDNIDAVLRYDRGAIAAGGWWRLLTAHIVHLDLHHLVLLRNICWRASGTAGCSWHASPANWPTSSSAVMSRRWSWWMHIFMGPRADSRSALHSAGGWL